jgi:hypothetical protein
MMENRIVSRRPVWGRLNVSAHLELAIASRVGVVRLSLPEGIIPRRVFKPQLVAVFGSAVAAAIAITGCLLNRVM